MEKLKTIDIKGKKYVTVSERIRYFNEVYPNGKITTEIEKVGDGIVLMQSMVTPDVEYSDRFFTGFAYEKEEGSFINKTSYIENCETSAVGRALAMMGIGVDTSIASAEEVQNAIKQQDATKELKTKPHESPEPGSDRKTYLEFKAKKEMEKKMVSDS